MMVFLGLYNVPGWGIGSLYGIHCQSYKHFLLLTHPHTFICEPGTGIEMSSFVACESGFIIDLVSLSGIL